MTVNHIFMRTHLIRILVFLSVLISCTSLKADESFSLTPQNSKIIGTIQYSVVGHYVATFEQFSGILKQDEKKKTIESVSLKMEVQSIKSNFSALDKIVRSSRLLDVKKHPYIIFESREIVKAKDGLLVKGTLDIHGIKQEVQFPFTAENVIMPDGRHAIKAHGRWSIPRKDYGIVWSKALDRSGIIVGNHVVVEWDVNALED